MMNYVRVSSLAFFALTASCLLALFFLESTELVRNIRPAGLRTFMNAQNSTARSMVIRSLFSTFQLDKLEMLKPLDHPRPFFKFKLLPAVEIRTDYLKAQEIKWSMITVIKSSYKRYEQREAIRTTWGGIRFLNGVRMHVIFVLGLPESPEEQETLKNESIKFEDILQVEMNETYRGIGLKALAAMQWIGETFPENWLYFSGDDDMYPNLEKLLINIQSMIDDARRAGNVENSLPIHCAFHQARTPHVHRAGKWIVTREEYPYDDYPPICLGGFYGMSVKLAKVIYNASRHYPYFRHDDVFITGFMRLIACDNASRYGLTMHETDQFCALSKIQNSGFQHIHMHPKLFKLRWIATENEMVANGVEIIKAPGADLKNWAGVA